MSLPHIFLHEGRIDFVWNESRYGKKGGWEILADHSVARVGGDLKARYTSYGLEGILKDVFALAACDFLVCTFSSQVSTYPGRSSRALEFKIQARNLT